MIVNEVFKKPILSFGLGKLLTKIPLGSKVTIWQNEVYNEDNYTIESSFGTVSGVNKIEYEPNEMGNESLDVAIKNTLSGLEIQSNFVDLTTFIRADTTLKTADTTLITADYNE